MANPSDVDWDDLRLALVAAEEGSAAGAARRLGIDQTTAARRLARLEQILGLALFDRVERRLVARPALTAAIADLRVMVEAARRATARLADERHRLEGHVVVSTVELLATRWLAPALATFRAAHPRVRLTLDLSDANVSIAHGEADVAIRLARPSGDEALTRRLGALAFDLYGPAGHPAPETLPLAAHGDALARLPERRWLAEHLAAAPIAFRADTAAALAEAAAAGHRALLPRLLGDADPRLARLAPPADPPTREVWLMIDPERRRDPAVAATVAWIDETLARVLGPDGRRTRGEGSSEGDEIS